MPDELTEDILEMSDEDFLKMGEPGVEAASEENTAASAAPVEEEVSEGTTEPEGDDSLGSAVEEPAGEVTQPDESGDKPKEKTEEPTSEAIDYKAEYEKLMTPFKANGVDIKVQNTDEIIQLMQMGANYHKKMLSLKPSLKIMKLLERNELLDEEKLTFLIDLSKKDETAIAKLIKDSGIDPLNIDTAATPAYTPKTTKVSDLEMDLDAVLESIQETPTYTKTLKVVSEAWDDASRNAIAAAPHIISVINEHIGNGTFDTVWSEVDRARRFGKLQGVSDFEAYKLMGDYLQSQGKLGPVAQPEKVNVTTTAQKRETDDKRKAQKKAATVTTGKATPSKLPVNILALPDEEFSKLPESAYTQIK